MANIDQRKYLKKYLDDDDVKRHKKKSREHSSSRSERVRIVDDDGEYKPSRKYDDDNDFILTGEDAPQVVGIVDDRPPELRAVEDFRNSNKWRSLEISSSRASRPGNKLDGSQRYTDRRRSRSRSPVKRDYSPPRRPERRDTSQASGARKRRSSDDYSPVRRKPEGESRYREANFSKNEKGSSYPHENNGRRREEFSRQSKGNNYGQYREAEPSYKDGHEYQRSATYTKQQQPYAQRNQHQDERRPYYTTAENGRSTEYHSREGQHRIDNRYTRNDVGKSNPFRANSPPTRSTYVSHRDDHERRRSPVRSNNPFRANRPSSLSPLPDRRGDAGTIDRRQVGGRPQKTNDARSRFDFHGSKPSSYGPRTNPPHYDNSGGKSNPFQGLNTSAVGRGSGPPAVKGSRTDSAQPYRSPPNRSMPPRGSYQGYEKRPESSSQSYDSYPRSRSPIKSSIQIVNSSSQYPRVDKRYQSDRREQPIGRPGGGGGYPQHSYAPRKPSHISNVKY